MKTLVSVRRDIKMKTISNFRILKGEWTKMACRQITVILVSLREHREEERFRIYGNQWLLDSFYVVMVRVWPTWASLKERDAEC